MHSNKIINFGGGDGSGYSNGGDDYGSAVVMVMVVVVMIVVVMVVVVMVVVVITVVMVSGRAS